MRVCMSLLKSSLFLSVLSLSFGLLLQLVRAFFSPSFILTDGMDSLKAEEEEGKKDREKRRRTASQEEKEEIGINEK